MNSFCKVQEKKLRIHACLFFFTSKPHKAGAISKKLCGTELQAEFISFVLTCSNICLEIYRKFAAQYFSSSHCKAI